MTTIDSFNYATFYGGRRVGVASRSTGLRCQLVLWNIDAIMNNNYIGLSFAGLLTLCYNIISVKTRQLRWKLTAWLQFYCTGYNFSMYGATMLLVRYKNAVMSYSWLQMWVCYNILQICNLLVFNSSTIEGSAFQICWMLQRCRF